MVLGYNVKISVEKEPQSTSSDGGLMDSAWPMFAHDTHHTGRSPYAPSSGNWPIVKWKFWIKGMTISSPAIDENGVIYIGSHEFHDFFFAINPDGTEKWRFDSGDWVDSSPAIAEDGTIYFGCLNGRLFAVNPDGSEKWWRGLGDGWVYSSPVIDNDGIIYAASVGSSRLCAVYPNGTIKWKFHANDWIYCSPAIDDDGVIYVGSCDGYMYAVYPNGTLKWKYYAGGTKGIGSAPTIGADGTIYFGCTNGYLYALHSNGTLKWKYNTGWYIGGSSPATGVDGKLYIGTNDRKICSINPDGTKNWHYSVAGEIGASPVIDNNGVIYCGDWDGYLYALNPDGTLKWKFLASDDGIQSSVAIAEDGTIYIAAYFKPSGGQGSYTYLYALEVIENEPPDKPTITGRLKGNPGKSYAYTFNAVDPDGDNVSYYIDWGDGTSDGWTDYYESGQDLNIAHTWNKIDYFSIRCKAKDICGAEGNWTDLIIHIPRNRATYNSLFLRFLEQFPLLQKILCYIL